MWSIVEYIQSGLEIPAYVWLVPLQVIGALLSIYITFHDADVLLILHNTSGWAKVSVAILSFLFLGCCQVIQVKRAWSRQMHDAEVVIEMSDNDLGVARKESTYDDRAANASSLHDFGAAERITPVALLTGVPFLLVHAMISAQCPVQLCVGDEIWMVPVEPPECSWDIRM
ncbi:pkbA [Symbiodinium sp. CCMP2592]|nr:pkbA [Symbiodinium sp. CCMP2592]